MRSGYQPVPEYLDASDLGDLEPWLDQRRSRGFRGGPIMDHRALRRAPYPRGSVVGGLVMMVVVFLLWCLAAGWVTRFWGWSMELCRVASGMPGFSSTVPYQLGPFHFDIPYMAFPAGLPTNLLWWIGAILSLGLLLISMFIPHRYLPLSYLLRVVAFFQITAQVFFALWLHSFPYGAAGYVHGMLIASLFFVALVPLVLGFTFYMFDFGLRRKVWLTLVMIVHPVLLVPLQYFVHAWVLHHTSLLYMPLLFFVCGLPANVMMFIAWFGWGFSWRNRWDLAHQAHLPRALRPEAAEEGDHG